MGSGDTLQGRRVEWPDDWRDSQPGDYCKVPEGEGPRRKDGQAVWYVRDPYGHVGSLMTHTVAEHEDGTITVSPSILDDAEYTQDDLARMGVVPIISGDKVKGWHGFLERGVWREA